MKKMAPTTCSSVSAGSTSRTSFRPGATAGSSPASTGHSRAASSALNQHSGDRRQTSPASSRSKSSTGNSTCTSSSSSRTSRKPSNGAMGKATRTNGKKSVYKHVPHALKPVHLVAKRNARERRRVQAVNSAFLRLRKHVPYEPRHKRLSKVKTLRVAITYISHLQEMIRDHDRRLSNRQHHHHQHHQQHHLNLLAEAATSSGPVVSSNGSDDLNVYDNGYQFMNGSCAEEGGGSHHRTIALHHHGMPASSSPLSSSSSSHFLHASSHGSVHGLVNADGLNGPWSENLQYTGPMDNGKMSTCPTENPVYFVPSCPPQHYDGTAGGSYLPYDSFSVQSPYQLLR